MKVGLLLLSLLLFFILQSCLDGSSFSPGSGYGSIVEADAIESKFKSAYLIKYTDTLLNKYPEYIIPDSLNDPILIHYPQENRTDTTFKYPDHFLVDVCFYFSDYPREIYFIQWGSGSEYLIREVENLETGIHYQVYPDSPTISNKEKQRIKSRFHAEIYSKIDSLISMSPEYKEALL